MKGLHENWLRMQNATSLCGRRSHPLPPRCPQLGVGVRLLAELAGHSHISTTERYIDVNADQLRNAVEML